METYDCYFGRLVGVVKCSVNLPLQVSFQEISLDDCIRKAFSLVKDTREKKKKKTQLTVSSLKKIKINKYQNQPILW